MKHKVAVSRNNSGSAKDDGGDGTWYWVCREPVCAKAGIRWTHKEALKEAIEHVQKHREFGFGVKK